LHSPEQGDVVDLDPALDQQLFEVPLGQTEPQVPAHGNQDDFGRETEPSERRAGLVDRRAETASLHPRNLTHRGSRSDAGRWLPVKGQWDLPGGGHWFCPLVATGSARWRPVEVPWG